MFRIGSDAAAAIRSVSAPETNSGFRENRPRTSDRYLSVTGITSSNALTSFD